MNFQFAPALDKFCFLSKHPRPMSELAKAYEPQDVEKKWYAAWQAADCFRADENSSKEAYSIVIPPPNVTGILHLGHVLNNSIQDILARRATAERQGSPLAPRHRPRGHRDSGEGRARAARDRRQDPPRPWPRRIPQARLGFQRQARRHHYQAVEAPRLLLRLVARAFHDGRGLHEMGQPGIRGPFQ